MNNSVKNGLSLLLRGNRFYSSEKYIPRYKKRKLISAIFPSRAVPESQRASPWVELNYLRNNPTLYPNTIKVISSDARAGTLVTVYSPTGHRIGAGLFNPPPARVSLRMVHYGSNQFDESHFYPILKSAIELRQKLGFQIGDNSFRVINSDGDGLSGLIVDKFDDVLSVKTHSLGIWKRLPKWCEFISQNIGTKRIVVEIEDSIAKIEGIAKEEFLGDNVHKVCVMENGLKYEVDFLKGHKTGFFCDQRVNRLKISHFSPNQNVLDLCCYTGGFSLNALLGGATSVTAVDIDPNAISQAKQNLKFNESTFHAKQNPNYESKITFLQEDSFIFGKKMIKLGKKWDVVICDPPKLIHSRTQESGIDKGIQKYTDLNEIAMKLTKPGGILVTCSCSGLLSKQGFLEILSKVAEGLGRRLQIFEVAGAAPDHPVMSNCPEGEYLKVIWARVL